MTLSEYKTLLNGYMLKTQDELESFAIQAFFISRASGFDKNGKPIIKKVTDLFDKDKAIREIKRKTGEIKVNSEKVERFKQSKERAEALLNGG